MEERKGRKVQELWNLIFFFLNMKVFVFLQFPDGLLYVFRDLGINLPIWRKECFSSWNTECY